MLLASTALETSMENGKASNSIYEHHKLPTQSSLVPFVV